MCLAEGYNFVMVSYVFALKKKKKSYISNTYFLFLYLCLSLLSAVCV